jgi:hypothetical protein
MKTLRRLGRGLGLALVVGWSTLAPWGETTPQVGGKLPAFTPLEEDAGRFDAKIYDEGTITDVTDFSFSGDAALGGIRSETSEAITKINLESIATIEVLDKGIYNSKRYPNLDLFAIKKISKNGATVELLIPRHVVVCGKEKATQDEKAWYLHKIDKIEITPTSGSETTVTQVKKIVGDEKKGNNAPKAKADEHEKTGIKTNEEYQEKEIKIVEKKTAPPRQRGLSSALEDFVTTIVGIITAVLKWIKHLIW